MSGPATRVDLMDSPRLPVITADSPPMDRSQAKALGLKVYPSWAYCKRSSKHGSLREASSNACVQCVELEANLMKDLRASAMDKLRAEAERKVRRELNALIAGAEKQAADILKAAQREAMDKAKQLERAKATREAKKAAKALAAPTPSAEPVEPMVDALEAFMGPPREGPEDGPETSASGCDRAPWD
jgi:hypothetical protein